MRNHIATKCNYSLPPLVGMTRIRGCSLFILFWFCCFFSSAQTSLSVSDIPDSLKKDAYSVVRDYQVSVTASPQQSLTAHYRKVVTILNKKGERHALWHRPTSSFDQLTSFSGKIYDEQGNVKGKIKRNAVHTSQYSEHLATDVQHNYFEPSELDYPYTIELEWDVKSSKGYMEYEYFFPIEHDRQSMEKASFILTIPADTKIRYTGMPHQWEAQKKSEGNNDVYAWNMPAMRCLIDDEYDDKPMFYCPSILAVPSDFKFGESSGTLDSWESLGKWYAQLADNRGTLLPADVHKVRELTADCKNDKEKIAALYKYLGEKTRYVSIQLGIGGWQPMTAEEVGKTGFGDCKALTNYMQALLKEAGITSCQTVISTEYADLLKGFPNMHQTNHVILTIPQTNGSNMVIECTNPQLPLGFVPGSYAGPEALQITGGEGKLIRIPEYTPQSNYERLVAEVQLQADGKSTIKFSDDHYGARYGGVRSIVYQDEKERKDNVAHWVSLQDPVIDKVKVNEVKTDTPHLDVQADMKVTYGKVNGNRIFLACNPFRDFHKPRFRNGRQRPIVVESSYSLDDEIRISLPENCVFSAGKKTESSSTDFGSYSLDIKQEGQKLIIKTKVSVNKGRFDISRKKEFSDFREALSNMTTRSIILEIK